MLSLEHTTIGYRRKGLMVSVQENLSLQFSKGAVNAVIGLNGAGKTTLMLTLAGLIKPLSGLVKIGHQKIADLSWKEKSKLLSLVLTHRVRQRNMTVEELVQMGRFPYSNFFGIQDKAGKIVVGESMELAGITSLKNRDIMTLSDGELQKAMIAKCLAQDTPVIILDEPTAFLDSPSKVELLALLKSIAGSLGRCIIYSTHETGLAIQFSDQLILMGKGRSTVNGIPQDLLNQGFINAFFDRDGISFDSNSLTFKNI